MEGVSSPRALDLVNHIRNGFDVACGRVDETTERFCYHALHPDSEFKREEQYQGILKAILQTAPPRSRVQFLQLTAKSTPPAMFAAYHGLRRKLLGKGILEVFEQIRALGSAQRTLLSLHPAIWAQNQTSAFIQLVDIRCRAWMKQVCDVQQNSKDIDESTWGREWPAPRLLVMQPSRFAVPEPERYWEREDAVTTEKWLNHFAEDVILTDELFGEALSR